MIDETKFNQLCTDVEVIKNRVVDFTKNQHSVNNDVEKRLRFLEKYAWLLVGGVGLISVLINVFVK